MINIENVSFGYHNNQVLSDISFQINKGEVILLIGGNGCGKTTLLYLLAGLYSPVSGRISIDQADYEKHSKMIRKKVGMMFQEPLGFSGSKVFEIVDFFKALNSISTSVDQIISLTKIEPFLDKKIESLSGGEKQKVALALSLIGGSEYILLDEPISALDVPSRQEFLSILQELKNRGIAILMTTHILEELRNISDKILYLKDGRIAYFQETQRLMENLGYSHRVTLTKADSSIVGNHKHYINENNEIVLYCKNEKEVDEIYRKNGMSDIHVDRVSLDDLFYITGQ